MTWILWIVLGIVLIFGLTVLRGAPYVPTKRRLLDQAFDELYSLTDKDTLVDIGSGDGVVLRAAARRGARAIGYELNPLLVIISRLVSRSPLISIYLADFWRTELPQETTVIYTFGESRDIKRMYKKAEQTALKYRKEIHFISFGFEVPGKKATKYDGSFYLYRIRPLPRSKTFER
jgi:hypothetical protein